MAGVYLSFPFCRQKCSYCNFASGVFPKSLESTYLAALDGEIKTHTWTWTPETVYIGGGTPSLLAPDAVAVLLDGIPGRPWIEATLEAAPGTLMPERVEGWRKAGITRVSLGVQSFVEPEIIRTGRRHNAQIVAREVAGLRDAGLDNFNIDLIAGLPGQTPASWRESLDWISRLEAPHVSVYMLEVDEDSRLGAEILTDGSRYGARDVPSDELTADLYETAVERLRALGILRYEISNFARPGFESRHNLKYWTQEPYAGFGADAHSFDGSLRWQNVESPAEYVERWSRGVAPRSESTAADIAGERFWIGLRLAAGVRPTPDEGRRFEGPIRRFVDAGLLAADGGVLRLTDRGVLLSNEVFQEFLPA